MNQQNFPQSAQSPRNDTGMTVEDTTGTGSGNPDGTIANSNLQQTQQWGYPNSAGMGNFGMAPSQPQTQSLQPVGTNWASSNGSNPKPCCFASNCGCQLSAILGIVIAMLGLLGGTATAVFAGTPSDDHLSDGRVVGIVAVVLSVTHLTANTFLLIGINKRKSILCKVWIFLSVIEIFCGMGILLAYGNIGLANIYTPMLLLIIAILMVAILFVESFLKELKGKKFQMGRQGQGNPLPFGVMQQQNYTRSYDHAPSTSANPPSSTQVATSYPPQGQ